ncbi:MAG TPA: phage portal protein [Hyphomicrobiaceae bacterium]|nr:phage portal protein [Hyphomicrobiaceae bacterium]
MATPRKTKSKRSLYDADAISKRTVLRAAYDIARSTDENANLWKYVDSLSAAEANNPSVRQTIRNRARYEVANNSYADGIVDTLAADTIGPEIQLQLGDTVIAERAEREFERWARDVRLWAKLRTMRRAKCVDGEVFGQLITNRKIANRVKLDLRLLECDMVESWVTSERVDEIDGIRFDDVGNPTEYRILKNHPGDSRGWATSKAGTWTPAGYVLHYFSESRPGQVRGVSELLPSLSLFGELRLYTKAVINAAARAAEFAAVMQTDLLPDQVAAELSDPLTTIEAPRNAIISLPEGWKMAQLKAEQPAQTYEMFKREIVNEMARPLSMPFNVAACDSSRYNYASGRLDHQTYDRSIEVERAEIRLAVLDRIYAAWLAEYSAIAGLTEAQVNAIRDHEWHFSGRGHVDPGKEASADQTRLANGTLTRARYWAKHGADWKREDAQWIKEMIERERMWNEARNAAGLPPAPMPSAPGSPANQPIPDKDDAETKEQDTDEV